MVRVVEVDESDGELSTTVKKPVVWQLDIWGTVTIKQKKNAIKMAKNGFLFMISHIPKVFKRLTS